jgi:hypothetical protein
LWAARRKHRKHWVFPLNAKEDDLDRNGLDRYKTLRRKNK